MSVLELLVILIISFLILKTEDIPHILKKVRKLYTFCNIVKHEILIYFNLEKHTNKRKNKGSVDQIRFYLEKLVDIGVEYEGEYSLTKIKDCYRKNYVKATKKKSKYFRKFNRNLFSLRKLK